VARGRETPQTRQAQSQQITALGAGESVHFVDHHAAQPLEHFTRVFMGDQKRERFGRRHQDVGRRAALTLLLAHGRIAGAAFGGDAKSHFDDWAFDIPVHVHRQGLQRGDVKRMQPVGRRGGKFDQTGEKSG
jgi:hypothetical protein